MYRNKAEEGSNFIIVLKEKTLGRFIWEKTEDVKATSGGAKRVQT